MAGLERSLIPLAVFAMIIVAIWLSSRDRRATIEARAELNKQLLDKFASAQELTAFLESEAGQRFLDGTGSDKREGPREKILGIIKPGCILSAIGIGFFWLGTQRSGLMIPAVPIFGAGFGLLIAAVVTYVLSKKWGLMNGEGKPSGRSE